VHSAFAIEIEFTAEKRLQNTEFELWEINFQWSHDGVGVEVGERYEDNQLVYLIG
jgi:hypothetical protein